MKTIFCLTDGGRAQSKTPNEKLDCTVRAFAIYTTMPYDKAHDLLKPFRQDRRKCRKFKEFMLTQNMVEIPFYGSLATFLSKFPVGRFLLRKRGHVFPVINGKVHDTGKLGLNTRIIGYMGACYEKTASI